MQCIAVSDNNMTKKMKFCACNVNQLDFYNGIEDILYKMNINISCHFISPNNMS